MTPEVNMGSRGELSGRAVAQAAEAATWHRDVFYEKFAATHHGRHGDGREVDTPLAVAYAGLRVVPVGVLKLQAGGRGLPAGGLTPGFRWTRYTHWIDGVKLARYTYDTPLTPDPVGGVDWDLWLPKHDAPALTAALRETPAALSAKAKCVFATLAGDLAPRVVAPAAVEFLNPVTMFTSVAHTSLRVRAVVPDDARRYAGLVFDAVGLMLDDKVVAMNPLLPPKYVVPGDNWNFTIDT